MSEKRIYKIIHWDVDEHKRFHSCSLWTLKEVLEEINRDHSDEFSCYNETDWQEGWQEWCAGWHTIVPNRHIEESN